MKFYNVAVETEPKITGSRNGVFSVEIKDKYSFASIEDKNIWRFYISENRKNKSRVLLNHYVLFDNSLLSDSIKFFAIEKKIKQLDFMSFTPYAQGVQFLVTERVYEILSKFRLPVHNKITAVIDRFDQKYYLIGFPMLPKNAYDFDKTTFFDYNRGVVIKFKNLEDYETASYERITASVKKIYLNFILEYDIIKTTKGVFFNSDIIEEFNKANITGFLVKDGILIN